MLAGARIKPIWSRARCSRALPLLSPNRPRCAPPLAGARARRRYFSRTNASNPPLGLLARRGSRASSATLPRTMSSCASRGAEIWLRFGRRRRNNRVLSASRMLDEHLLHQSICFFHVVVVMSFADLADFGELLNAELA